MDGKTIMGLGILAVPVVAGWIWVIVRGRSADTSDYAVRSTSIFIDLSHAEVRGIRRAFPLLLTTVTSFYGMALIGNLGPELWYTDPQWRILGWIVIIGMAAPFLLAILVFLFNWPKVFVAQRHQDEPGYLADKRHWD